MKPIQRVVSALPHRPVYTMHRYFARRPYNVFSNIIEHYSEEGDLILDPFMGGGVTVVESVLLNRNAVGIDLNPMAVFITRFQLKDIDLELLKSEFEKLVDSVSPIIEECFETSCPECNNKIVADWYEYSAEAICGTCNESFTLEIADKASPGRWLCPNCSLAGMETNVEVICNSKTSFRPINKYCRCDNCGLDEVCPVNKEDILRLDKSDDLLQREVESGLWIPNAKIPVCNMERESALHRKGITNFKQLFTSRHLLSLGAIKRVIGNSDRTVMEALLFIFSSTLRYTNRMTTRNESWRGNNPLEWSKPGYWLPQMHLEANPIIQFRRRLNAFLKGKNNLRKVSDGKDLHELKAEQILSSVGFTGFHLDNRSSTDILLPDNSVDVIITDPPYGSNVHYADLTNFWAVWLPEMGMGDLISTDEEAVVARKKFEGAKNFDDYREILQRCFMECQRVLKPDSYMVLTFNNREPASWAALMIAAKNSGFILPEGGLMYQPGPNAYRHTANNRRAGSLRGDFIFSFSNQINLAEGNEPSQRIVDLFTEDEIVETIRDILLENGSMNPEDMFTELYVHIVPVIYQRIFSTSTDGDEITRMIERVAEIEILDSEKRDKLKKHFDYNDGYWSIRGV